MRLRNNSSAIRFSALANKAVDPGKETRDLTVLVDVIENVLKQTKGFEVILSDADIEYLSDLFDRFFTPLLEEVFAAGAKRRKRNKYLDDPTGILHVKDRIIEQRLKRQQAQSKALAHLREKEARIQSESNFIDESGNPVNDKMTVQALGKDVKPKLHEEAPTDIRSILEHNLAVMTSASGEPIGKPAAIVAQPGGTPVSHDPKDYQKPRTVPPGMPELPGADTLVNNVAQSQAALDAAKGNLARG